MKKNIVFIICMLVLVSISSCRISKKAAYFDFETTCLNTEGDGSLTLRVWGEGRNAFDAAEQAKKNAVYDVLFKGITKGLQGYQSRPLVPEVNARQKYMDYFDNFFKDGGAYIEFVSLNDRRLGTSEFRRKAGDQVKWATTIRVLVPQLRQRMKDDGILQN